MCSSDLFPSHDIRNGAPASWDQFWKLIADNNGPNKWSWLYIPPEPLKSQLKELAIKIMEPLLEAQMIILDEPQGQDPKFSELKIYV